MIPRLIRLKHPGVCRSCGTALSAGSQAYWASGQGAACRLCGVAAFSGPRVHAAGPGATAPADQARWVAYCDYLHACVQAEARESVSVLESGTGWTSLGLNLLADPTVRVPAPPEVASQARAGAASLRVGWPVFAVAQEDRTHRLVPMLVVDVDVSAEAGASLVPLDDRPSVNPRLGQSLLDRSDIALLEDVARRNPELPAFELARLMVDELDLTVEDLSGAPHDPTASGHLQNVVLLEQLAGTAFTVHLQRELIALRERTDWPGTAAAALLRDSPPINEVTRRIVVAPIPLNDSQLDAVLAAASPVTVVTGPPGTGKSQVVTGVAASCWQEQESFLVTSTNNAAVDVAVARLQEVHPVLALRSGNQQVRERLALTAAELLKEPTGPGPGQLDLARLRESYAALVDLRERSARRSRTQIRLLGAHVALEDATDGVLLDPHAQPESGQADVVRRIARLTRKARLSWWRRRRLRRPAAEVGVRLSVAPPRIHAWTQAWIETTAATAELRALGALVPAHDVDAVIDDWRRASEDVLRLQAAYALHSGRTVLQRLADDRPRPAGRALVEASDLHALPGWAVTALSVARTLPLQAGVVDTLILDEASQCSLAHVLPLAYRARRVVALGDPNQLRPVVTITPAEEARAASVAGLGVGTLVAQQLSFRESSAFDALARSSGHVHLLDEHYRCHPAIAGWFNREFYGGTLTVLTRVDPDARRGIEAEPVHGISERPSGGSWINEAEAKRVCELAVEIVAEGGSLGVVTPFAAQASLIRRALMDGQGEEWMARHDVAVATAHRFQGGERDVVIFSSVVTPGMPVRSARWIQSQRNLVNVGASRARRLLVLVGHPEAAAAHDLPTLGSLWSAAATSVVDDNAVEADLTEPARRFWRAFDDALGVITPRQRIEGYDIDFAWTAPWGMSVAIEIDDDRPDHPPRSRRRDVERDRVLNRVGWQVVRIPGWYCYAHPDAVIESLRDTFVALQDPTSATVELMPWIGR